MKKTLRAKGTIPGGAQVFQRMFTRLGCTARPPHFVVEYFPYANLSHTIRLRNEICYARLSDLLRGAPVRILESVAAILISRLYRRRLPRALGHVYREYSLSSEMRRKMNRIRGTRGAKREHSPAGRHHHLEPAFERLNAQYFQSGVARPRQIALRSPRSCWTTFCFMKCCT
ncbi:MAG: hypothetical protein HY046_08105 [Acidobacteria bacterium]|nr:hypothetical protein [Acidobacteriota bacterium]